MTLGFVDLYNKVAEQAWSMYDADAESVEDFETGLKSSINKALTELWCSYEFPFRVKKYTIKTKVGVTSYNMPTGNIYKKSVNGEKVYSVKIDKDYLEYADNLDTIELEDGVPTKFEVYNDKFLVNTNPDDVYTIVIEYLELYADEELKQENINLEPKTSSFISDDELLSNGINLNNNSSFKPVQNSTSLQQPVTTQQPVVNQPVLNNTPQNSPVMYSAPSFNYKKWVSERPTNNIGTNLVKDGLEIVGGLAQLLGQGALGAKDFAVSGLKDLSSLQNLNNAIVPNVLNGNFGAIPNAFDAYNNELKENHPLISGFAGSLGKDLKDRDINAQKFKNGELTYPQFLEAQRLSARENHPALLALKDALVQGIKEQYGQGDRDISKDGIDWGKFGQSFLQHPLMNGLDVVGVGEIGKINKISDAVRAAETMKNIKKGASQAAERQARIDAKVAELKAKGEKVPNNIAEIVGNDLVHYDEQGNKFRYDINGNKQYFDKPTDNLVLRPFDNALQSERVQKWVQATDGSVQNILGTFAGMKENNPLLGKQASARARLRQLEKDRKNKTNQELVDAERENNQNFGNLTDEQGKDIVKDIEGKAEATNPNIEIPNTKVTENSENVLKGEIIKNETPDIPNSKNVTSDANSLKGEVVRDNVAQTGNIINKTNADGIVEINGKYYWDNAKGEMPDNIAPEKMNGVIIDGKSYVEIGDVPKDLKQVEQPFEAITDDVKNVAKTEESKVQPVDLDKLAEANKDYKVNPKFKEIDEEFKNSDNNVQSVKTEEKPVLDNSVSKEDLAPVNDVPSVRTKEDLQNEIAQINQELKDARHKGMPRQKRAEFIHKKNARLKELRAELKNIHSQNSGIRYNSNKNFDKNDVSKLMDDIQQGIITPEQFEQEISNISKTKNTNTSKLTNKKDIVSQDAKNYLNEKEIFENGITDKDYEFFNAGRKFRDSENANDSIEFIKSLKNSSLGEYNEVKELLDNLDESDIVKTLENSGYAKDNQLTFGAINENGEVFVRRTRVNGSKLKRREIFSNIIHELKHKINTIKGENIVDKFGNTSDHYTKIIDELNIILKEQTPKIDKNGNKCYNIDGETFTEKQIKELIDDNWNFYENHPDEVSARQAADDFEKLYSKAKNEFKSKRDERIYNERYTNNKTSKSISKQQVGNNDVGKNRKRTDRIREARKKTSSSIPKKRTKRVIKSPDTEVVNALFDTKNKFKNKLKQNSDFYKSIGKLTDDTENANIIDTFAAYKNGVTKRDKITDSMREEALKVINSLPEDKRPFYVPRMYDEHLTKADFGLGHYRQLDDIDELKHRSYTGDADKIKNGKLTRNFNIEKIANRLDEHRIKLDNMSKYIDDITNSLAKPLDKIENLQKGYVAFNPEKIKSVFFGKTNFEDLVVDGLKEHRSIEASLKNALQKNADELKTDAEEVLQKLQNSTDNLYQIPEKVYEDLVNSVSYKSNKALNIWDIGTDAFKKNVLGLNAKWVINNRIGNTIMAAFKGTNLLNPMNVKRISKLSDDLFPAELIGETFHSAERMGKLKSTGYKGLDNVLSLLDGNSVNDSKALSALSLPGKVVNKISKTVFDTNQKFEVMDRKTAYLKGIDKKKKEILKATGKKFMSDKELLTYAKNNPELKKEILKHVDDTLGDYSSMSHIERSIIKRIIPFYSWLRTITRHTLSLPKTNPIRTSIMSKISAFSHEERDDLPFYQKNAVDTDYRSEKDNRELMLNFEHSVPYSTFGESGENPMSLFDPAIKNAVDAAAGVNTYNGMPLVSKRYTSNTGGGYIDTKGGGEIENLPASEKTKAYLIKTLRDKLPGLKQTERVAGGILFSKEHKPYDKLYDTDFGGYMEEDIRKNAKGWSGKEQLLRYVLPIQKKGKVTKNKNNYRYKKTHKRMLNKE